MKRVLITPGEPAGIGPDITLEAIQQPWPCEIIVIANPDLLKERAQQLRLPLTLQLADLKTPPTLHQPGIVKIIPLDLKETVVPGVLNVRNVPVVLKALTEAARICQNQLADAVVTGPVHKGIINQAGTPFIGHTEFFGTLCNENQDPVMLFVNETFKVALATTHLPLKDVPAAITKKHLERILHVLYADLKKYFSISSPRILVAGLNPHAGEEGILGMEEIETITPVIQRFKNQGYHIEGPLAADTLFTPKRLATADAILAMYHDQALPVVKHSGFGATVNVTLGLPFLRTSVDHGVALDIAGSGKAHAGSMKQAIALAARQ